MKVGIISAGTGERLREGGLTVPKPLVPVGGTPMIARAIQAAAGEGATSVACIVNDLNPEVADYLRRNSWPLPVDVVVRTTPSSMESLFGLCPLLDREPFLLLTVDAVFAPRTLGRFLSAARRMEAAGGVLALTRFVDDEKPLWARVGPDRKIVALGDNARPSSLVTAGFYFFSPKIFTLMEEARALKLNALRQFLALLMERGLPLFGVSVAKTIDVDHPRDLDTAEAWLRRRDGLRSG